MESALAAARSQLAEAGPELIFDFLKPDRIAATAEELADRDEGDPVSASWVRKVSTRHGGFAKEEFALAMLESAAERLGMAIEANLAGLRAAIEEVARGGGREALGPALIADLRAYLRLDPDDTPARAAERLHYLALASSDQGRGSAFREALRARRERSEQRYWRELQAELLAAVDRQLDETIAPGQLQNALIALLEGYAVQRQSGAEVSEEEMVDVVLRVFASHTRHRGRPGLDPDRELFGRPRLAGEPEALAGLTHDRDSLFAAALASLAAADPEAGEIVRHANLHGPRGSPSRPRSPQAAELAAAMSEHLQGGGEVRRLVSLESRAHLERVLELERESARQGRFHLRAVLVAPPILSPLIVGERSAMLAHEAGAAGSVGSAIELINPGAVQLASASFDAIWNDSNTFTLIDESEPYPRGVREAARRLYELAGRDGAGAAPTDGESG